MKHLNNVKGMCGWLKRVRGLKSTAMALVLGGLVSAVGAYGQTPVLEPTHVWNDPVAPTSVLGVGAVLDGEWAMVLDENNSTRGHAVGAVQVYRKSPGGYGFFQTIYPNPAVSGTGLFRNSLSLKGNVMTFSRRSKHTYNPFVLVRATQAYVYEFNGTQWVVGGLLDPIPSPSGLDLSKHWSWWGAVVIDDSHVAYAGWGMRAAGGSVAGATPRGEIGMPTIHFYHKVGNAWVPEQLWWGQGLPSGTGYFPVRLASHGGRLVGVSSNQMSFAVFDQDSNGRWQLEQWVSNPRWLDSYGDPVASIAIQEDLIVFGQPFGFSERSGLIQPQPGTVQIFRETLQGWQFEAELVASDAWFGTELASPWRSDRFGYAVDVDRGRIAVSALQAHIDPNLQGLDDGFGAAYVFEQEGSQWVEKYRLWAESPSRGEQFGTALSLDGNTVIVTNGWLTSDGNTFNAQVFYLPLGSTICEGQANSGGDAAELAVTGFEDPGFGYLHLSATQVPTGQAVFFLAGTQAALIQNPGGSQGDLCLGGNLARFNRPGEFGLADSAGSFALSIDPFSMPVSPTRPILSGETWYFQAWYRDNGTSNFTSAVGVPFQ